MVITTTVLSTTPIQTISFKKSETNVSAATKKEVQSPRIIEDNYSDSTQNVTWDCIYFGSYPQSEITSKDGSVYNKLKNATSWDNNDTTIDGVKYRKLKGEDAI